MPLSDEQAALIARAATKSLVAGGDSDPATRMQREARRREKALQALPKGGLHPGRGRPRKKATAEDRKFDPPYVRNIQS
jgi:hypothetical protein